MPGAQPTSRLKWPTILTLVSIVGSALTWWWANGVTIAGWEGLGDAMGRLYFAVPVIVVLALVGIPAFLVLVYRLIKLGIR